MTVARNAQADHATFIERIRRLKRFGRHALLTAGVLLVVAAAWRLLRIGDWLAAHGTLVCGVLALVCALTVMWQEILLGPSSPNYPPGPWWVRMFLFFWMVGMAVRGVDVLSSLGGAHPQALAWSAVQGWITQTAAQLAILALIAMERRPEWFWSAAKRAEARAKAGGPGDVAAAAAEIATAAVSGLAPAQDPTAFLSPDTRRKLQALP